MKVPLRVPMKVTIPVPILNPAPTPNPILVTKQRTAVDKKVKLKAVKMSFRSSRAPSLAKVICGKEAPSLAKVICGKEALSLWKVICGKKAPSQEAISGKPSEVKNSSSGEKNVLEEAGKTEETHQQTLPLEPMVRKATRMLLLLAQSVMDKSSKQFSLALVEVTPKIRALHGAKVVKLLDTAKVAKPLVTAKVAKPLVALLEVALVAVKPLLALLEVALKAKPPDTVKAAKPPVALVVPLKAKPPDTVKAAKPPVALVVPLKAKPPDTVKVAKPLVALVVPLKAKPPDTMALVRSLPLVPIRMNNTVKPSKRSAAREVWLKSEPRTGQDQVLAPSHSHRFRPRWAVEVSLRAKLSPKAVASSDQPRPRARSSLKWAAASSLKGRHRHNTLDILGCSPSSTLSQLTVDAATDIAPAAAPSHSHRFRPRLAVEFSLRAKLSPKAVASSDQPRPRARSSLKWAAASSLKDRHSHKQDTLTVGSEVESGLKSSSNMLLHSKNDYMFLF